MTVEKTHVVVTRYLPPGKVPLVHTYGPMTYARAKTVRDESLETHASKVADGTFSATVSKMLDIDAKNKQAEKREVRKTVGLIALERFVDSGMEIAHDDVKISEAMEGVRDLTEKAICDLGGSGREGMKLLVRVALAAREWGLVAPIAEMGREANALHECVTELDKWERSL